MRLLRFGDKLDAEGCDLRVTPNAVRYPRKLSRGGRRRGSGGIFCRSRFNKRIQHTQPRDLPPPPILGGGASIPVQVRLRCAFVGRVGDRGSAPTLKDSQVLMGFLRRVSAGDGGIVSNPGGKLDLLPQGEGAVILPARDSGAGWNFSLSTKTMWIDCAGETQRRGSILPLILVSFCVSS